MHEQCFDCKVPIESFDTCNDCGMISLCSVCKADHDRDCSGDGE